jgi:hypothetical protein
VNGGQNHPNIKHIWRQVAAFISDRSAIRERAFENTFEEVLENCEGGRDQALEDLILELSVRLVGTDKMMNLAIKRLIVCEWGERYEFEASQGSDRYLFL